MRRAERLPQPLPQCRCAPKKRFYSCLNDQLPKSLPYRLVPGSSNSKRQNMSDDHFDSEAQGVQTTAQKTGLSEEVTSSLNSKDIYPYWKTSVEEDRKAAKQVEQRVLKARESRDEQDVAAQRVQQQYKSVPRSNR